MFENTIFLFRRDLRLEDNTALYYASKLSKTVIPIFIFSPQQVTTNSWKSDKSVQFMIESLADLEESIQKKNGKLHFFYGDVIDILKKITKQTKIDSIFFNKDYTVFSKTRDAKIATFCKQLDISCNTFHDVCLFQPKTILTGNNEPYQKFTPFYNSCLKCIHTIPTLKKKHYTNFSKTIYKSSITLYKAYNRYTEPVHESLLKGGREYGEKKMKYVSYFKTYGKERNTLTYNTTQLSPYLKYGCISIRELFYEIKKHFGVKNDLTRQLIWRDFYIHVMDAFPRVLQGKSLKEKYDNIKWLNNPKWIRAWKQGNTGFPIVDACMRQLNISGYMHNRGRLIVSSFLVKILLVDWRIGEKYFAQHLIDYDPAANNGNWQWVSGSGADSQPYFRIFNPWSQSKKYDPHAIFIKTWIPELQYIDSKYIHQWNTYCNKIECKNTRYPNPIVDYTEMRNKSIALYKKYI